jgi:hypothetical protein
MLSGGYVRYGESVTITMLKHKKAIWMSNSPSELRDMQDLVDCVQGDRVLVAGLGLGVLVHLLHQEGKVITVVEISTDVCEMVGPYLPEEVTLVNADFRKWVSDRDLKFDWVILDIWGNISSDDILDMCELYQQVGLKGSVWGLDYALDQLNSLVCGYEDPADMANMLEMEGFPGLADYVYGEYDSDDYCTSYCECDGEGCDKGDWAGYEWDVLNEAIYAVYKLEVV